MYFDDSSNVPPFDRQSLPPPPVRQPPQASLLQDHLERMMKENSAPKSPPPEQNAEHQQPQPQAPEAAAPGEQPQKPQRPITTAYCLRQTTYARHLHAIMEPYVGDCGQHPAFMEMMGQIFQECNYPDDPLAKMMIQQLVLFNELIGVLFRRGLQAPTIEVANVFFAAGHRAAEDYRKTSNQFREILHALAQRKQAEAKPEEATAAKEPVIVKRLKKPTQKSTRKKTG